MANSIININILSLSLSACIVIRSWLESSRLGAMIEIAVRKVHLLAYT
jgi:hypothetical protein